MAFQFFNVYQNTIKGDLIQIGNTLGLSKAVNSNLPGQLGSIGAFITTDQTKQVTGWPQGTTLLYTENSSAAILTLPANATVAHAELIWSASYVVPGGNVTANINDAITFIDSNGTSHSLTGTSVSITGIALSENAENSTNYVKSVDVTSIVSAAGSGTYTCGAVPCTMAANCNSLQYAGWSLYVAYNLDTAPVRNIVLFVGQTTSIDSPYAIPANYPGLPYPIRLFYTVGEGDAIITGDQFNTRPGTGTQVILLGTPVQPAASNPFASIIGDQNGGIDTSGTFGTYNPSGTAGTNITGGRQGFDIANNVDLLPAMTGAAFTSLNLDIGLNTDPAIMMANGLVVDLAEPVADLTKYVDRTQARGLDTLNYTLVYRFGTVPSGVPVAKINIIDTIPSGVTFQSGSVIINSTPYATTTPNPPGINLPSISVPTTFTITFKATVNSTIDPVTIPNSAFANFDFINTGTTFTTTNNSNTVNTFVDPFSAVSYKNVSPVYGDVGSVLTYTITIPNNGATLTNVVFLDTSPSGTIFVPNTFSVNNGAPTADNPNPPGVSIIDLAPNTITTISFQVVVTTIPVPNPILNSANITSNYTGTVPNSVSPGLNTNIVATTINNANLSSNKIVNKAFANIFDTLTYTITFKNNGNVTALNIIFQDTIPTDTVLVPGSLSQDGVPVSGSQTPPGTTLPKNIAPGQSSTITFKVTINTIPNPNPIPNAATAIFTYTIDPSAVPNTTNQGSTNSNQVNTQVNHASLGNIQKLVDNIYATCGTTLTYTILVPNSGNTPAINVVISDTIANGLTFVPGTVNINNAPTSYLPSAMFVGTIPAGQTATITFNAVVKC